MSLAQQHEDGGSEHAPGRPSKRTRADTPKQKAPRKKYVKGKQGGLQGIMKMPMEVFMEIAHHVHPGDLISLIRTSKFFRTMLLNRSAILIWQRALSNVPELPPCPTAMVEPQYAALMFSKHCTFCSATATGKPDPYLQVRLCSSCRDTELEEKKIGAFGGPMGYSIPFTMHIKRTKKSFQEHPTYYLIPQRRELDRVQGEFTRNNDNKGLAEWRAQQRKSYETQLKEGESLLKYLDSVASSRLDELKDRKSKRREQIHERLKALGWEDKYFHFPGDDNAGKQWNSLVEVSKPLTERTWTNILPKLTQLLEENRLQLDEFHRQQRRQERVDKVMELLCQLKRDTHPYQSIVDALRLECPPIEIGSFFMEQEPLLAAPFPEEKVVNGWDFFVKLYEEEHSLQRVEELFHERQDSICQKLLEWRAQVEAQLVEQYKSSFREGASPLTDADVTLTIQGSTDLTKHLSNNSRFLLRADTVFMPKVTAPPSEANQEHGPIADQVHFPGIPRIINDPYLFGNEFDDEYHEDEARALDSYTRHAGMETIIKALLRQLQMPDVAYIELASMGKAFVCGRCDHGKAMEWHTLVKHYHQRRRKWVGDRFVPNTYRTLHPVVFRNVHDLAVDANPKPLVRIVPSDENNTSPPHSYNSVAECTICRGVDLYEDSSFESLAKMREHMLEVHDITEPVADLHFTDVSRMADRILDWVLLDRRDWEQKWDSSHDNQSASAITSHEAETPPGLDPQPASSS